MANKRLTERQSECLFKIMCHLQSEGVKTIPSGEKLAKVIGTGKRNANDHLKRLEDKLTETGCIEHDGRIRKLNENYLCTFRESAILILYIRDRCSNENSRVRKSEVIEQFLADHSELGLEPKGIELIIDKCTTAKYLIPVYFNEEFLTVDERVANELLYLKLLAKQTI